jgi:hypothetical protein
MVIHERGIMIFLLITAYSCMNSGCSGPTWLICHWHHHSNCLVGSMWDITLIKKIVISYISQNSTIQTQTLNPVLADFVANIILFDLSCLDLVAGLLATQFRTTPLINKEIAWNHGTYKYTRYTNLLVGSLLNTGINNCLSYYNANVTCKDTVLGVCSFTVLTDRSLTLTFIFPLNFLLNQILICCCHPKIF